MHHNDGIKSSRSIMCRESRESMNDDNPKAEVLDSNTDSDETKCNLSFIISKFYTRNN
jgi:hypothetical protein